MNRKQIKLAARVIKKQIDAGERTLKEFATTGNPDVVKAVERLVREESQKSSVRLIGRVERETEKAVLFKAALDEYNGDMAGRQAWFPKSQCTVLERAMGPLDQIEVPEWLVKAKAAK